MNITHEMLLGLEKAIKKSGTLNEFNDYSLNFSDLYLLYSENEDGKFIMVNERIAANKAKPIFIAHYDENRIISSKSCQEIEKEMRERFL